MLPACAGGCGGRSNLAAEQTNCTTITACVQGGHASISVDRIESLDGSQFRFASGISYPTKVGSVWTLRLQFTDSTTKATLEDDVRNMPNYNACGGTSHLYQPATTPAGRVVCIGPSGSGTSTFVYFRSAGLIHTVYLLPPMPKLDQRQVDNMLFGYVDALR